MPSNPAASAPCAFSTMTSRSMRICGRKRKYSIDVSPRGRDRAEHDPTPTAPPRGTAHRAAASHPATTNGPPGRRRSARPSPPDRRRGRRSRDGGRRPGRGGRDDRPCPRRCQNPADAVEVEQRLGRRHGDRSVVTVPAFDDHVHAADRTERKHRRADQHAGRRLAADDLVAGEVPPRHAERHPSRTVQRAAEREEGVESGGRRWLRRPGGRTGTGRCGRRRRTVARLRARAARHDGVETHRWPRADRRQPVLLGEVVEHVPLEVVGVATVRRSGGHRQQGHRHGVPYRWPRSRRPDRIGAARPAGRSQIPEAVAAELTATRRAGRRPRPRRRARSGPRRGRGPTAGRRRPGRAGTSRARGSAPGPCWSATSGSASVTRT